MCVKFLSGDLNPDPYPSHPTNIYTCKVTTTPRGSGGDLHIDYKMAKSSERILFPPHGIYNQNLIALFPFTIDTYKNIKAIKIL